MDTQLPDQTGARAWRIGVASLDCRAVDAFVEGLQAARGIELVRMPAAEDSMRTMIEERRPDAVVIVESSAQLRSPVQALSEDHSIAGSLLVTLLLRRDGGRPHVPHANCAEGSRSGDRPTTTILGERLRSPARLETENSHSGERERRDGCEKPPNNRLSRQEKLILEAIARGDSSETIGTMLGISRNTVYVHRHNAMRKLGARNAAELVAMAFRLGILGPQE